jgi:hypothetical protein
LSTVLNDADRPMSGDLAVNGHSRSGAIAPDTALTRQTRSASP